MRRPSRRLLVGATIMGALALLALLAPWVSRGDPVQIDAVLARRIVPPFSRDATGAWHWLGTDRFGRDLLARTLLAGRLSLAIGVSGALLASAIGVAVGLLAAWRGGLVDATLRWIIDAMLALPRLVLLLVGAALWPPSAWTVLVILGATGWMSVARLVRAEARQLRSATFVEAARALGMNDRRVVLRHVLPNAIGSAIVATTLGVGNAILLESGLSFLGLGVQPPTPSWGNMIAGGRELLLTAPWIALVPGVALVATAVGTALIGDALEDRLGREGVRAN
ncbi:MAG: ABC transporter permease [Gemmatimonadaceae bacterium]|jgi:peptide/nickel transport system permease protein|nr:ABC transporter permease [Gemmatimonadaceae bacterium]